MKTGDSKGFDLKFPDDYHGKEVAGKTAHFDVTVSEVAAPKLPQIDAEFALSLGVPDGDLAKMRGEVKANLEREVKQRLKAKTKDQVMQALLDATPVDVPKSLIALSSALATPSAHSTTFSSSTTDSMSRNRSGCE